MRFISKKRYAAFCLLGSFLAIAFALSGNETEEPSTTAVILTLIFTISIFWLGILLIIAFFRFLRKGVSNVSIGQNAKRQIREKMVEILEDGVITEQEEKELYELVEALGYDKSYADSLREKAFSKELQVILKRIQKARRYSPEDEQQIEQISNDHRINAVMDSAFYHYRKLWEAENGYFELSPIDNHGIMLGKGEECYFSAPAEWMQDKTRRQYAGSVGGSISIPIAKGVRYRVGRSTPQYETTTSTETVSEGQLFITSKK